MSELKIYQIDAFAAELFRGNPAAIVPLEEWLGDEKMQSIAAENNLAETAFFVPDEAGFHLRWFTPTQEVNLCGHATLAAAFVVFNELAYRGPKIKFSTLSGTLEVKRDDDRGSAMLSMDFPRRATRECESVPDLLPRGLGAAPREVLVADDDTNYYAVYASESEVRQVRPDFSLLEKLHPYGVSITAPGDEVDFVSRYFAPSYGIPEDPVTGSTHCALTPYWAGKLSKSKMRARQISSRVGELFVEDHAGRVAIAGRAVKYLDGIIFV